MRRALGRRVRALALTLAPTLFALALGCGGEARETGPPAPAGVPTGESPGALAASAVATDATDQAAPSETTTTNEAPTDEAPTGAMAADAAGAEAAEDAVEGPPRPSAEDCRAACDNALTVTLRELPADAADVRAAVLRSMQDQCPKTCVEKGTIAGVACIKAARKGSDLVECPP